MDKSAQKVAAVKLCDKGWLYDPITLTWYSNIVEKGQNKLVYFDIEGWQVDLVTHSHDKTKWIGVKEFQTA